jgi:hypothetical protein
MNEWMAEKLINIGPLVRLTLEATIQKTAELW